jgi:hypothetical protein
MESACIPILISNLKKCHVSLFIFYVFSSTKWENWCVEFVLLEGWKDGWHMMEGGGGRESG